MRNAALALCLLFPQLPKGGTARPRGLKRMPLPPAQHKRGVTAGGAGGIRARQGAFMVAGMCRADHAAGWSVHHQLSAGCHPPCLALLLLLS